MRSLLRVLFGIGVPGFKGLTPHTRRYEISCTHTFFPDDILRCPWPIRSDGARIAHPVRLADCLYVPRGSEINAMPGRPKKFIWNGARGCPGKF